MAAARLLWFARHQPETIAAATAALSIKDFVVLYLTGELVSDAVTSRGLVHARTGAPAIEVLERVGLDPALVPPAHLPWDVAGTVLPSAAVVLGVRPGIPVAVGWGDLYCAILASGALDGPGHPIDIAGTAEGIGVATVDELSVPGLVSMPLPDRGWVIYGSTKAGCGALAWFLGATAPGSPAPASELDRLVEPLLESRPEILFLPHLGGERAPLWDPDIRGAFLGLDLHHTWADLGRAVLEGVAFSVRQVLALVEASTHPPGPGGPLLTAGLAAARSTAWNRIKPSVLDRPLVVVGDGRGGGPRGRHARRHGGRALRRAPGGGTGHGGASDSGRAGRRSGCVVRATFEAYEEAQRVLGGVDKVLAAAADPAGAPGSVDERN